MTLKKGRQVLMPHSRHKFKRGGLLWKTRPAWELLYRPLCCPSYFIQSTLFGFRESVEIFPLIPSACQRGVFLFHSPHGPEKGAIRQSQSPHPQFQARSGENTQAAACLIQDGRARPGFLWLLSYPACRQQLTKESAAKHLDTNHANT